MEIYGRDYRFRLTVGAACDIAAHCPGGELGKFRELLLGDVQHATEGRAAFLCAMSRGEEEARAFEEPGYRPQPLSPELLRTLDMATFNALLAEASEAFLAGLQTAVPVKAKKNEADGSSAAP